MPQFVFATWFPRRIYLVVGILVTIVVLVCLRHLHPLTGKQDETYSVRMKNELSLLTYNIWFKPEKMNERMEALGQLVRELRPDIMSFQEATLDNLAVLKKQSWFSHYHLFPQEISRKLGRSFVIILSALPVKTWWQHYYLNDNASYKRRMVVAEVVSAMPGFAISGTHLAYAGERTLMREKQLREAINKLSYYQNACIMGDLNIEDKVDGNIVLPKLWIDAWLSIPGNTDQSGLTWDRSKTPFESVLKRTVNATSYQARLDRVLCKLQDFKVKEMKVIGDKVTKSGVLPSDHFGLFVVLEFSKNSRQITKAASGVKEVYFKRPPGWEKLIRFKI